MVQFLYPGATLPTWGASSTYIGINAGSNSSTDDFLDFHYNGGNSLFKVDHNGTTTAGGLIALGQVAFQDTAWPNTAAGPMMQFLYTGATAPTWNTQSSGGTYLGINAGNYSQNADFLDFHYNGGNSLFKVDHYGNVNSVAAFNSTNQWAFSSNGSWPNNAGGPMMQFLYPGATAATFNTHGTYIGINAGSNSTLADFLDFHNSGGNSLFKVDSNGTATAGGLAALGQVAFTDTTWPNTAAGPMMQFLYTGATAPTWNTQSSGGTYIGINAGNYSQNADFLDFHYNGGSSLFKVDHNGNVAALGGVSTSKVQITASQSTVSCSTSGTAVFSQPEQGGSDKKVVVHLAACVGTAAYTFPTSYTNTPGIFASSTVAASLVTSLSTTAVTITGATSSGTIVLEDY
jgi:hypothetical protein